MTEKPAPTAEQPADAATAFEQLRREISFQRSAIEGLTAAKDKLPDYSLTLRDMALRLTQVEEWLARIDDRPAMRLTPLTIATEMHEGLITYRADDRKLLVEARDALARSLGRVEGMIKQKRSNDEQDWWVTWAGTGGVLCGMFLTLVGVAVWV
ncbi:MULTISPECIES: DUF6118 family protein [unclassified Sphingopyxis]|jgi:hypothetical protein|uniref:DUF6118 family protein n=1 Tax=unclassified Sphingopyxis TaxID=2614943 RepID=UPI00072FF2BC|nr:MULTISPECIES: DUF6118 family protein [unclassified Sphingopyxis]KTE25553.1 hypothetical protein ATE61_10855 [Sphingopyxis sp. H057]KTE53572.1 hypothetical protein ATE64_06785 [Sphingopyxis sp. H073]KTE56165.1 hypothetical protein ATE69_06770 [Sphingopyxis sp. H071]KTE61858.1 hypothetical protein ATE66_03625 [Sphingopyxis sp. H107]KTE67131.1 hypothetical protein ATE65_03630 [Sphingopyxis sp. H100]